MTRVMVMKTTGTDAGAALFVNLLSFWKKLKPAVLHSMASCCGLMLWMLPNAWLCYRWLFRGSLVADGNFTPDHMKMRCPEDDVNLTHGYGYVVEEGRY